MHGHQTEIVTVRMAAAKRTKKTPSEASIAIRNTLATNLRNARLEAGLTQPRLGELANVSKDYIRRIEKGDDEANVSIELLCDLAAHVGMSVPNLLTPQFPKAKRRS
jgi:DNA-binding XRE family transcriptional regulator